MLNDWFLLVFESFCIFDMQKTVLASSTCKKLFSPVSTILYRFLHVDAGNYILADGASTDTSRRFEDDGDRLAILEIHNRLGIRCGHCRVLACDLSPGLIFTPCEFIPSGFMSRAEFRQAGEGA